MSNNYLVIMAGGIGTRFWPCSRTDFPKQFIDFFGTGRSLLQQTFDRFKPIIPVENIYIASNKQYRELILEQLPELKESQLLLEPARRNTAPCIAYAMNKIKSINKDANVVISPADHLILKEEVFRQTIATGLDYVSRSDTLITMGIKPSRPETGYGYIQVESGKSEGDVYKVKTFTEKPNLELAKIFLDSGDFLWNSGMFIWSVRSIEKAFREYEAELWAKFDVEGKYLTEGEQEFIDSMYRMCKNLSIDYAIMERATNVGVIAADFGWSDLGTWGSLYDLAEQKDEEENATLKGRVIYHKAKGNVVSMKEGKIAVVQGIDDCIVVDNENVLLICKREDEQHIRDYVGEVKEAFGEDYV